MKLFSSYNKMGGKKGTCGLLIVSLAVLLFLFLVQNDRLSGLSEGLTEIVEQGGETAPAAEEIQAAEVWILPLWRRSCSS